MQGQRCLRGRERCTAACEVKLRFPVFRGQLTLLELLRACAIPGFLVFSKLVLDETFAKSLGAHKTKFVHLGRLERRM